MAVLKAPFPILQILFDHSGSTDHGELLIYAVQRRDHDRVKVFEYVIGKGNFSINNIMYQNRPDCYSFWSCVANGTALHHAAVVGKLDMVETLLAKGADPLIKDSRARLAIDRTRFHGHAGVVERLRPLSIPSSEPHHDFTDVDSRRARKL